VDAGSISEQRIQKIDASVSGLFSRGTAEKENAFRTLCDFLNDGDVDAVFGELSRRGDTQSTYWLVRYLVNIETPHGFDKLFALALNDKSAAREAALAGMTKISGRAKVELLSRVLAESGNSDDARFAAENLGETGSTMATVPLLDAFEKWKNDPETAAAMVRALGRIRDARAIPPLSREVSRTGGILQEEILLSLSRFSSKFRSKEVKRCLSSGNPHVRGIAYAVMLNSEKRAWEPRIAAALNRENTDIKHGILSSIKEIHTRVLFDTVLDLAVNGENVQLRTLARSAAKKARPVPACRWLIRRMGTASAELAMLIIDLLTGHADRPSVRDTMFKRYAVSGNAREKLAIIEFLGNLRDESAIGFLRDIVEAGDAFGYAAAASLVRLVDQGRMDIVSRMLELDPDKFSLPIQVFLRLLSRLPEDADIPEDLEDRILSFCGSDDRQIRYQAVRCLHIVRKKIPTGILIDLLKNDPREDIRDAAGKSMRRVLGRHPEEQAPVLSICASDPRLYSAMRSIIRDLASVPGKFNDIVDYLTGRAFLAKRTEGDSAGRDEMRFTTLLRDLAVHNKAGFLEFIRTRARADDQRQVLMRVLNSTDIGQSCGLKVGFMAEQYPSASRGTRLEYLRFFRDMAVRDERIAEVVFREFSLGTDEELRTAAEDVISAWLVAAESGSSGEGVARHE